MTERESPIQRELRASTWINPAVELRVSGSMIGSHYAIEQTEMFIRHLSEILGYEGNAHLFFLLREIAARQTAECARAACCLTANALSTLPRMTRSYAKALAILAKVTAHLANLVDPSTAPRPKPGQQ